MTWRLDLRKLNGIPCRSTCHADVAIAGLGNRALVFEGVGREAKVRSEYGKEVKPKTVTRSLISSKQLSVLWLKDDCGWLCGDAAWSVEDIVFADIHEFGCVWCAFAVCLGPADGFIAYGGSVIRNALAVAHRPSKEYGFLN